MSTATMTPLAAKAMRRLFQLLEDNFNAETGEYIGDYSDAKIAQECEISEDAVKKHRTAAFGKLQPPSELQKLKLDLDDLTKFALQNDNEIRARLKELSARAASMLRKFD